LRLALAGGGTGGHILPGLHLLAHTRSTSARLPRALDDVLWFTSGRAVEDRVMGGSFAEGESTPFERVILQLEPEGGGAPSRSALALRTAPAILRARRALARHRSQVLLGLGGFTSLPSVVAARSLGIPVALLEINAEPGSATRWLARYATRVLHAWPSTWKRAVAGGDPRRAQVHRWIGPPLSPAFTSRGVSDDDRGASERARADLGFDPARALLLVLGGSQGSSALNRFVATHAPALVAEGVQVLHQTGPGKLGEAAASFSGYRALEYLDPVAPALAASTLVLSRGGASTLAEIAALRRPAVVVPYPHHADRHQERNAQELGAGVRIVPESRLGTSVRQELVELAGASGRAERERMSAAMRAVVPLDAAARLYAELAAIART
jgi:UDP-N-acetylglucosamine:LPS N-acetylglucosamine transferase